ncbi:Cellular nucleic acid-binding protein, partial [Mucuna pruriens]
MGRKEKPNAKAIIENEQDTLNAASTPSLVFTSDDDDDYEANQDLSLKIVEKAIRMRAAKHAPNDAASTKPELALPQNDGVSDSEMTVKKKTTRLKVQAGDQSVIMAEEQEMEETTEAADNHESVEDSTVQTGDNMVLRKLLRGPRYFDPPDNNSWGACFNCGEEGHAAVHCTAEKRKKPCYVCGDLGHNAKQCTKAQDCFICKKGGHRAKNCPEKHASTSKNISICLKCGNSGHDMFFCRNEYSLDDIKEIQCYVCKRLGHLCCVNTDDATPGEISCYKCGQLGHTGLACSRLRDEIATGATPGSCFKCGEEGHFARECTSSVKAGKRYRESSNTKDKSFQKENDYMGNRSAPNDMGRARKKKRPPMEERGFSTPKKSKSRGGWIEDHSTETTPKKSKSRGGWTAEHPSEQKGYTTPKKSKSRGGWKEEHHEEFFPPMSTRSSFRFSGTPSSRSTNIHSYGSESRTPNYKSSKVWNGHAGTSMSQGSARSNHHRFSASRFGNFSTDGPGRHYKWW